MISWRSLFSSFLSWLLLTPFPVVLPPDVPLLSSFGFSAELSFMFVVSLVCVFLDWLLRLGGAYHTEVNHFRKVVQCLWAGAAAFHIPFSRGTLLWLSCPAAPRSSRSGTSFHCRPGDALISASTLVFVHGFLLLCYAHILVEDLLQWLPEVGRLRGRKVESERDGEGDWWCGRCGVLCWHRSAPLPPVRHVTGFQFRSLFWFFILCM